MSINKLNQIIKETEQAAREIYYAMTYLEDAHPARANLEIALLRLGVTSPKQVGLSLRVLTKIS
jgi:hypothetical protein